ncbi:hypothetical protein P154DRAFT_175031 [Amniculicola lignicola CBS 123094]|uniref:Uncharacterized protein n=1 Tax=Amniculicola lignicola CBS 123094 TaxID=1392246 RepID=A0A6A5WIH2_9PLEO|nr:hypothetical protein P154DRAFT_175031 [Amniculicola lignicola CBS 123094]
MASFNGHPALHRPGIKHMENGLLDLSNIPKYLIPIVNRNAIDAPLLGLPRELRDMIWKYFFEDFTFLLHMERVIYHGAYLPLHLMIRRSQGQKTLTHPAFEIMRTCRQLYSETATLPFVHGTFILSRYPHYEEDTPLESQRIQMLLPGQKDAIRTLKQSSEVYPSIMNLLDLEFRLRQDFVGLKTIIVRKDLPQFCMYKSLWGESWKEKWETYLWEIEGVQTEIKVVEI